MKELKLPFDVHFGGVDKKPEPLQVQPEQPKDDDDDKPTSDYVKTVLGFDPDKV